jgi:hypothetical protein
METVFNAILWFLVLAFPWMVIINIVEYFRELRHPIPPPAKRDSWDPVDWS